MRVCSGAWPGTRCWSGTTAPTWPTTRGSRRWTLAASPHFWQTPYAGLYIPVAYNVLGLEVAATKWLTGEPHTARIDATLFHIANVLLHLANGAFVFLLLRRLVRANGPAMLGALLFVLHPLQVESVAWISESRGLLAATFTLAAVLAICRATEPARLSESDDLASSTRRAAIPTRLLWHGLGLLLVAAALLSKPSAVTAPVVAAAVLWAGRTPIVRISRAVAPWLALSIAAVIVTQRVQSTEAFATAPPLWQRPMIAADALWFYGAKLLWPAALAPDYGRTPAWVLQGWWPLSALAIVIIAGGAAMFLSRRSPLVLAGSAIAVGSLLPVLGLASFHHQVISTVADRYMYIPLVGVGLMAAAGMARVRSRAAWCAALGAAAALGVLSFRQSAHWVNDETLWRHNIAVVPRSPVAHNNLGRLLQRQGRLAEAEPLLLAALEASERLAIVLVNVAELRLAQGRTSDAEIAYRRAIDAAPNYALAAVGLGALLGRWAGPLRLGRCSSGHWRLNLGTSRP